MTCTPFTQTSQSSSHPTVNIALDSVFASENVYRAHIWGSVVENSPPELQMTCAINGGPATPIIVAFCHAESSKDSEVFQGAAPGSVGVTRHDESVMTSGVALAVTAHVMNSKADRKTETAARRGHNE